MLKSGANICFAALSGAVSFPLVQKFYRFLSGFQNEHGHAERRLYFWNRKT
jgi:hypothetical protein